MTDDYTPPDALRAPALNAHGVQFVDLLERPEWIHAALERVVEGYFNDLDFGAGPGRKAVISIGMVDLGPYGTVEIDAVVAFGPDTDLTPGQHIDFTGVPIKLDGFSRNILLEAGHLTT